MLTKTVLYVSTDGACDLAEVPFNWQHGESLPVDAKAMARCCSTLPPVRTIAQR